MTLDLSQGLARVDQQPKYNIRLVHWGTRYTRQLEYKKQVELMNILEDRGEDQQERITKCKKHYDRLMTAEKRKAFILRVKNKIKRIVGMK